jgi:predicted nicotinamide N-methyase
MDRSAQEGEHPMSRSSGAVLASFVTTRPDSFDGLRLLPLPLVPEVRLYLADDAIVLRARLDASTGYQPEALWASAWAGGQALARYVLDHPSVVAGRRVLDVASGSGLVAIAAALAGADAVTANDIDPYASAVTAMNAGANAVTVATTCEDVLDGDGGDAEVVLVGDAFYNAELAERMRGFLDRVSARGAVVLVGDPDRGHLPPRWFETVTTYRVRALDAAEDAQITRVAVLRPARSPRTGG